MSFICVGQVRIMEVSCTWSFSLVAGLSMVSIVNWIENC